MSWPGCLLYSVLIFTWYRMTTSALYAFTIGARVRKTKPELYYEKKVTVIRIFDLLVIAGLTIGLLFLRKTGYSISLGE